MSRNIDIEIFNYEMFRRTGEPTTVAKAIHNKATSKDKANWVEAKPALRFVKNCLAFFTLFRTVKSFFNIYTFIDRP